MFVIFRLLLVLIFLTLVACAHQSQQHPLLEVQNSIEENELSMLHAKHNMPIVYVNDTAYLLNKACYRDRLYSHYIEKRQYSMTNEVREWLTYKEGRSYKYTMENRQHKMFLEARQFSEYRRDRDYLLQTEERHSKAFTEQRYYSEAVENRLYQVVNDNLYCVPDEKIEKIRVVRRDKLPVRNYRYFYEGKLQKAKNGFLTLN